MPGTTIDRIRQQVEELENYNLPEPFRETSNTGTSSNNNDVVNKSLLERYTNLRDEYLKKAIENTVAKHVTTYDGENFQLPDVPYQAKELDAMRQNVQNRLQQTARNVQNNLEQLNADYARLQERKKDLRRMLEEFDGDGDSLDLETDNDEPDVDEEDLQAQQERLLSLQQRKKELLSKLDRLQEEHRQVDLETTEAEANLSIISYDDEAIAEIEKENEKLRQKINENKEMATYFETMRLVTEELCGIRLLSVGEGNTEGVDVLLRIEVLHSHQVDIELEADERQKEGLRVASAKLLTPSTIKATVGEDPRQIILLPIPVFDDLVGLAQPQPRPKALAFVVQEIAARIEMIQERAEELVALFSNKSFRLINSSSSPNDYGRCDHEVVISIPEYDVKVLMRMTPDCPRIPGSVYLDDISGPNKDKLQEILESTRKPLHKRPVDLLEELKTGLDAHK